MSKKTELMVFQRCIAVPGVRFSRTGLIFDHVDDDTLVAAGAFLHAFDACAMWCWGDLLAAYCGFRLKKDEAELGKFDEITAQEKMRNYGAHYASICGKEPKTLWHWKSASEFYESSRRREDLSWAHHIEAKDGSGGDKAVADNWLDLAQQNGWSRSELRAAIRRSKRAAQEPEEPLPQLVLPMEFVEARRYASAHIRSVDDMDVEVAKALLVELSPVLEYATALARRVGNFSLGQNLPTSPGKESLRAAS